MVAPRGPHATNMASTTSAAVTTGGCLADRSLSTASAAAGAHSGSFTVLCGNDRAIDARVDRMPATPSPVLLDTNDGDGVAYVRLVWASHTRATSRPAPAVSSMCVTAITTGALGAWVATRRRYGTGFGWRAWHTITYTAVGEKNTGWLV